MEMEGNGQGADQPITIKVRDQTGEEMFFKVKRGIAMKKVFDAYAQRTGVQPNALKFTLDGNRLKDTDTPKMLEMEDNDQIDVFLEKVGESGVESELAVGDDAVIIQVKQGEETIAFKVKKSAKMSKIMEEFATRRGIPVELIRFLYNGDKIGREDTPEKLQMKDNDEIDAMIHQTGGDRTRI